MTATQSFNLVARVGDLRVRRNARGRFRVWGPSIRQMGPEFEHLDAAIGYAETVSPAGAKAELYQGEWL